MVGAPRVLRHAGLRRSIAAFAALMVGEWALVAALSIHAYRVDGPVAVGLLGLRFVPAAAVGLAAQPLIQARQPARVLRLVAVLRALVLGTLTAGLASGMPFSVVLAAISLDAAIGALYRPAQSALLPSLAVTPRELTAAAGLIGNVKALSQVTGAFIGGAVVVATSTAGVAGAAAALMALAAALVPHQTTRAVLLAAGRASARPSRSMRRRALNVAALATTRALVRGLWLAMVVVVAIRLIDLGASGVGILMAASAAGALVALPIAFRLFATGRLAVGLGLALVTAAAPIAALAAFHAPAIALALVAVHGTGMALAEAASLGLLHRLLDARSVAGLVGPMESAKLAFEGAGSLLAPALIALAGTRGALAVAGAVPLLFVVADWRVLRQIDEAAGTRTQLVELLRAVELFRGLTIAGLEEIAAGAETCTIVAGSEVIRQGELGETFYVVAAGKAEVLIDGYRVGVVTRGMGFGERALLRGGVRAATVRALGELEVVEIPRDVFLAAVAGGQRVVAQMDPAAVKSLPELLPALPLFAQLPLETLSRAIERFELADYPSQAQLVRQGDRGDRFFVLLAGNAEVVVDGEVVGGLVAGDGFGEIALLHDVPRRATVRARQPVRVAFLERDAFTELVESADMPVMA